MTEKQAFTQYGINASAYPEGADLSTIPDCSQAHNDGRGGLVSVDIFVKICMLQ
jgi:hypothetical protein